MRGLAATASAAVCLCLAPAAAANPVPFTGSLATGGKVSFDLKRTPKGERKVLHFAWKNIRVTCQKKGLPVDYAESGYFYPAEPPLPRWPLVLERRFEQHAIFHEDATETEPAHDGTADVTGGFPDSWRAAQGTLRVAGDTPAGHDDCESGTVDWTAKRV